MKEYKAEYRANNGSTYPLSGYTYTNFRKAVEEIKIIARGEHFQQAGNVTTVTVMDSAGKTLYRAELHGKNKRFIIKKDE